MRKLKLFLTLMLVAFLGYGQMWGAVTGSIASSIADGDQVVLINKDGGKEFNGISSSNVGQKADYTGTTPTGACILTVETGKSGTNTFSFKMSNGNYLGYTSTSTSSNNYLYAVSNPSTNDQKKQVSWTVSFNSNNEATITNVYNTQRTLRYNSSSPRFCCYTGTSQQLVKFFKLSASDKPTVSVSPDGGEFVGSVTVALTPSEGATAYYTTKSAIKDNPTTTGWTAYDADNKPSFSANTTLYVASIKESTWSDVVTKTFTKVEANYTSIPTFKGAAPQVDTWVEFTAASNIVITGVNGRNVYIQDANNNAICLYFASNSTWTKGHKVTGAFKAKYATYGNMPEMYVDAGNEGTLEAATEADIPEAIEVSSLATSTINSHMCQYVKLTGAKFQAQALTSKVVDLKDASDNTLKFYDNLAVTNGKELPLTASSCDVYGVLISFKQNNNNINEILPVDVACINAGTATLPTLSQEGSTDAANPTMVAKGLTITVNPAANFNCQLNGSALNAEEGVTVNDEESNTEIAISSSRDYYTTANATYYFKAIPPTTPTYAITVNQPAKGGTLAVSNENPEAGATITLTATPTNEHFTFNNDWLVRKTGDSQATPEPVTNNQFTMPAYAVDVTGSFTEADKVTVLFAKGDNTASGDIPGSIEDKYADESITLPANPFTLAGSKFLGWKHSLTNAIHQPGSYTITADDAAEENITFTAEWEELSVWATTFSSSVTLSTTGGTSASTAKVRLDNEDLVGVDALKAGTSGAAGAVVITVPAGTTKLHYHAYGWKGDNVTLTISAPDGVTITAPSPATQALVSNDGITGNSPFTLDEAKPAEDAYYSISLSGVDADKAITFTATSGKRFVIFGVNAEYPALITLSPTSYDFDEVSEASSAEVEFTITPNDMVTGNLVASIVDANVADKFTVGAIANNKVTVTFAPGSEGDFSAKLKVAMENDATVFAEANLTGKGISALSPEILVDVTPIDFGTIIQDEDAGKQIVAVSMENVDENGVSAVISGTVFSLNTDNLTEAGNIEISANTAVPGEYSEQLTLSANGATPKQITVSMVVANKWAYTYSSNVAISSSQDVKVTITEGETTTNYDAVRTNKAASAIITIPVGTTHLYVHMAAWNNESQTVTISGDCFNADKSQAITADSHVAGSGTTFDIDDDAYKYFYEIVLDKEVTAETAVTITAASGKRFVLFGVNQEGGVVPVLESIEIKGDLATKTGYKAGDALDLDGLTVEATYSLAGVNQTPVDITDKLGDGLTLTYDPLVENQTSVTITATYEGKTDDITITELEVASADPKIFVEPSLTVNFGSVEVGDAVPAAQTITITLTNVATVTATLGGTNPEAFSISKTEGIVDGDEITISVIANTDAKASYSATIAISDGAEGAADKTVNLSFEVTEPVVEDDVTGTWTLVTNATTIAAGKKVIIAQYVNADGAINTMAGQASNNRSVIASTVAGTTLTPAVGTKVMTLANAGEGKFYLMTSDGEYLYNASTSTKSYLRTKDEDEDASWTIAADADGVATITSVENTNRTKMRYNPNTSGDPLFNCYATGQQNIALYMLEEDEPEPQYETIRENLEPNRYYTICMEKNITAVKNATFWNLRYKNAEPATEVYLEEATTIEAGKPYIFQAGATTLDVIYGTDSEDDPINNGALRGTFSDLDAYQLAAKEGVIYLLIQNAIRPNDGNYLNAHRAYIDYSALTVETPVPAPGRRVRAIPMQSNVVTGCEEINASETPVKMMIDGQLFIIRGEKMYDATGRLVK